MWRRAAGRLEFLLLQNRRDGRADTWVLPKGHLQRGECESEAAEREILEETGLRPIAPLLPLDEHTYRYGDVEGRRHVKTVAWFVCEVDAEAIVMWCKEEGFVAADWLGAAEARERATFASARALIDRAATYR